MSLTCLYNGIIATNITAANKELGRDSNKGPRNRITKSKRMQENKLAACVLPPVES